MPINLAPKETLEESPFWKKFIYWSTNIGRIVIIGTQLIVLSAFFTRFFLDRQIIDLSEEIKTKQTIIKSTSELESTFRTTQDQLSSIKILKQKQNKYAETLKTFIQKVPQENSLQKIQVSENKLKIDGRAQSGENFAQFLINLTASEDVEQIALDGARITPEGELEFNINVKTKDKSAKTKVT
jgi:Tfp pilus assembly protein PilN